MLDIKYIRENLEEVKKQIEKRGAEIDWEKLIKLDNERRDILYRIETLRSESNIIAKEKQRNDRAIEIKRMLKDLEPQLQEAEENFKVIAVTIPNIPQDDVPKGKDEKDNQIVRESGKIKIKTGKDHVELGKTLDIVDIERASKVSGPRFYYLKNQAVELAFVRDVKQ